MSTDATVNPDLAARHRAQRSPLDTGRDEPRLRGRPARRQRRQRRDQVDRHAPSAAASATCSGWSTPTRSGLPRSSSRPERSVTGSAPGGCSSAGSVLFMVASVVCGLAPRPRRARRRPRDPGDRGRRARALLADAAQPRLHRAGRPLARRRPVAGRGEPRALRRTADRRRADRHPRLASDLLHQRAGGAARHLPDPALRDRDLAVARPGRRRQRSGAGRADVDRARGGHDRGRRPGLRLAAGPRRLRAGRGSGRRVRGGRGARRAADAAAAPVREPDVQRDGGDGAADQHRLLRADLRLQPAVPARAGPDRRCRRGWRWRRS